MLKSLTAALTALFFAAPAYAVTHVTLEYTGKPLRIIECAGSYCNMDFGRHQGSLTIIAEKYQKAFGVTSLANQTINLSTGGHYYYDQNGVEGMQPEWLDAISWSPTAFPATAYSTLSIQLGANLQVTNWALDAADGPPDAYSGPTGDGFDFYGSFVTASVTGGDWTTTVETVPVPPALMLSLSMLPVFGLIARRRRRLRANPPMAGHISPTANSYTLSTR